MCKECYSNNNRIAPLLNPLDCLENHTQYMCGTYGRCICIEHAQNRIDENCKEAFTVGELRYEYISEYYSFHAEEARNI